MTSPGCVQQWTDTDWEEGKVNAKLLDQDLKNLILIVAGIKYPKIKLKWLNIKNYFEF